MDDMKFQVQGLEGHGVDITLPYMVHYINADIVCNVFTQMPLGHKILAPLHLNSPRGPRTRPVAGGGAKPSPPLLLEDAELPATGCLFCRGDFFAVPILMCIFSPTCDHRNPIIRATSGCSSAGIRVQQGVGLQRHGISVPPLCHHCVTIVSPLCHLQRVVFTWSLLQLD